MAVRNTMCSGILVCVRTSAAILTPPALFELPLHVISALLAVLIVWGSTNLAIRIAVEAQVPPFLLISMRFAVAGAILFVIARVRSERMRTPIEWRNCWRPD
jgi:drug/metabolite transporter (DMT)-like permease